MLFFLFIFTVTFTNNMPIYLYFFLIFLCIIPISISLKWQNTINTFLGKCAYLNWTVKKGKCLSEFPWYAYAFLVSTGYLKICAVQMKRLVGNSRTVCS